MTAGRRTCEAQRLARATTSIRPGRRTPVVVAPMSSELRYLRVSVEQLPEVSGEVSLEAAECFELRLAFGGSAIEVGAR